ncbi:nucleoside diphosphate-linked moiety X motif 13 isoform X2 [Electrophorus electricus]|uniref:nucleoside diphosphate-linked moiety X motif 13 isoform X2 n=1 Tax=Electrophorus electricus TaxID=8005 RepID=UPI0015D0159A|nr:nucleoside diphosphate-linked moiety X motif 13 isoform X2 [Electrophorus electricus]
MMCTCICTLGSLLKMRSLQLLFNPNLLFSRPLSTYLSRTRYLMTLKEDDEACRHALKSGTLLLYHELAPLLRRSEGTCHLARFTCPDVGRTLEELGKGKELIREAVLLGCRETGVPQFALDVGGFDRNGMEQLCNGVFTDLRKAFFLLTEPEASLAAKGQALLRWHQTHGFCSATGQPTVRNQSGSQRVCPNSGVTYYPQMAPVVIVLVSDGSRCLLARQRSFPTGMYSALAGFCDLGETLEEALRRELAEEVGLEAEDLRYSASQHWPFPQSSFMVACHATVSPHKTQVSLDKTELEDARWCSLEEIQAALTIRKPPHNPEAQPPGFWIPPAYAVANRLIQEWADERGLKLK